MKGSNLEMRRNVTQRPPVDTEKFNRITAEVLRLTAKFEKIKAKSRSEETRIR